MTAARSTPVTPLPHYRIPAEPQDFPGLVAFWDFQEAKGDRVSRLGEPYRLGEAAGSITTVRSSDNPWGPRAAYLKEGQYFSIARADCPQLNVHGPGQAVTVVAWIRRARKSHRQCEFIAGQWNETNRGRQYGLFLDIPAYGQEHKVSAHVSSGGGPTPGYRYCMDVAYSRTPVGWEGWHCVGLSYDGQQAAAWLDGLLEEQPTVNPYLLPGGLHDGGVDGSDFTVGAVHRGGEMGNFFTGLIGGLGVWRRALSAAEMWALAQPSRDGSAGHPPAS